MNAKLSNQNSTTLLHIPSGYYVTFPTEVTEVTEVIALINVILTREYKEAGHGLGNSKHPIIHWLWECSKYAKSAVLINTQNPNPISFDPPLIESEFEML